MNVSGWAMAGCYLGLLGFCLPLVGLLFAVPGLICSIMALKAPPRQDSYGSVTSNIRAWVGLVLSSLAILIYGALGIWLLIDRPWAR